MRALEGRLIRLQAEADSRERKLGKLAADRDGLQTRLKKAQAASKEAGAAQKKLERQLGSSSKALQESQAAAAASAAAVSAAQRQVAELAAELAAVRASLEQKQEDARALGQAEVQASTAASLMQAERQQRTEAQGLRWVDRVLLCCAVLCTQPASCPASALSVRERINASTAYHTNSLPVRLPAAST